MRSRLSDAELELLSKGTSGMSKPEVQSPRGNDISTMESSPSRRTNRGLVH